MKKLLGLFILALMLIPVTTFALEVIDDSHIGSGGNMGSGCKDKSCWRSIDSGYGLQAIRISIYYNLGRKERNNENN